MLIVLLFSSFIVEAQIEATTMNGKKVILKSDGTWEYVKKEINETPISNVNLSDCKYLKNEVDEFTGDRKLITKPQRIGKKKPERIGRGVTEYLNMYLSRINDNYYISAIYTGDLGCVSSNSFIIIKLINEKTIKLFHKGEIECGDNLVMLFHLEEEDYNSLLQSYVDKIRVSGTEYYADIEMVKPNFFIDFLKCIELK